MSLDMVLVGDPDACRKVLLASNVHPPLDALGKAKSLRQWNESGLVEAQGRGQRFFGILVHLRAVQWIRVWLLCLLPSTGSTVCVRIL